MRIVFLGAGAFGTPTLERLAAEHQITLVVTQPDKPAGRKMALTPTPVGAWAAERGFPLIKPENVNAPEVVERIHQAGPEALVVIAFGQYLGKAVRESAWAINLHGSRLPRWRGAAPINHAVLAGDAETGNSVIGVAQRMDAGEVYGMTRRAIPPEMTAGELHDLLSADGPALVLRVLDDRRRGAAHGAAQDETKVTLAGKLSREDGWVDFGRRAEECRRRVHGLTPWPGVTVKIGEESLKLLRVETVVPGSEQDAVRDHPPTAAAPGTLLDAAGGVVACGAGTALRLIDVLPAGKRAMGWAEYARGRRLAAGARVEGGAPC